MNPLSAAVRVQVALMSWVEEASESTNQNPPYFTSPQLDDTRYSSPLQRRWHASKQSAMGVLTPSDPGGCDNPDTFLWHLTHQRHVALSSPSSRLLCSSTEALTHTHTQAKHILLALLCFLPNIFTLYLLNIGPHALHVPSICILWGVLTHGCTDLRAGSYSGQIRG